MQVTPQSIGLHSKVPFLVLKMEQLVLVSLLLERSAKR